MSHSHSNKKNHKKSVSKNKSKAVIPEAQESSKDINQDAPQDSENVSSQQDHAENITDEAAPVRVEFPYSDVVRSYVPDAMAIADKALGDWKSEGSFMNLGIENPYANMAVSFSLQNAKKIEKKLEEKGVLPVVRMGFEVLKNKVSKQK